MDFYPDVVNHCSAPIAAEVRAIDSTTPSGSDALIDILMGRGLADNCLASVLGLVASSIGPNTELSFVTDYFQFAYRLAAQNPLQVREAIGTAAARISFRQMPDAGAAVFAALRANRIDIRPTLAKTFDSDWSFTLPQDPTWQYHLYLADLGTTGAVESLAKKIASTPNGNDATNLLKSLATVRNDEVRQVLAKYRNDQRRADAPDGPGLTIAQTVPLLLAN